MDDLKQGFPNTKTCGLIHMIYGLQGYCFLVLWFFEQLSWICYLVLLQKFWSLNKEDEIFTQSYSFLLALIKCSVVMLKILHDLRELILCIPLYTYQQTVCEGIILPVSLKSINHDINVIFKFNNSVITMKIYFSICHYQWNI